MAQRHRAKAAYPGRSADAEQPALPESTRVLSPQSQRPRTREITPAGDDGGGNGSVHVLLHADQPGSPPLADDMDSGKGWHGGVKRGGKQPSNWFNTVMGVLLLALAVFGYAVRLAPGKGVLWRRLARC